MSIVDNVNNLSIGFKDLSREDQVKVAMIKVAKVAIPVLAGAAVAAAVWFLMPVAVPAGIFAFSLSGFVGGGFSLAKIEHLAFKKLNRMEDEIKSHYYTKDEIKSGNYCVNFREEGWASKSKDMVLTYAKSIDACLVVVKEDEGRINGVDKAALDEIIKNESDDDIKLNICFANSQNYGSVVRSWFQSQIEGRIELLIVEDPNQKAQIINDLNGRMTKLVNILLVQNTSEFVAVEGIDGNQAFKTESKFACETVFHWDSGRAEINVRQLADP